MFSVRYRIGELINCKQSCLFAFPMQDEVDKYQLFEGLLIDIEQVGRLNQAQVAEAIGYDESTVSRAKNRGTLSDKLLRAVKRLHQDVLLKARREFAEKQNAAGEMSIEDAVEPYGSEWIRIGKLRRLELEQMSRAAGVSVDEFVSELIDQRGVEFVKTLKDVFTNGNPELAKALEPDRDKALPQENMAATNAAREFAREAAKGAVEGMTALQILQRKHGKDSK